MDEFSLIVGSLDEGGDEVNEPVTLALVIRIFNQGLDAPP